jgi:hypothetical protein
VRRFEGARGALVLCLALIALALAARATAQDATPVGERESRTETLVLIERNDNIFVLDQGPTGPSAGDWQVWGPNPLYDEANGVDTGATTQGTCFALPAGPDCYANETILFPDGSTLEIQGIEGGAAQPSTRTIVGGSGRYLGAGGTVTVAPTEDETVWTKTLEIVLPTEG